VAIVDLPTDVSVLLGLPASFISLGCGGVLVNLCSCGVPQAKAEDGADHESESLRIEVRKQVKAKTPTWAKRI
jgi:hypothetical protein